MVKQGGGARLMVGADVLKGLLKSKNFTFPGYQKCDLRGVLSTFFISFELQHADVQHYL